MGRKRLICILALMCCFFERSYAEEFKFEPSEIEKKSYHIGGYLELKPSASIADKDAAFYKLRYYDASDEEILDQLTATAQIEGSFQKGIASIFARANLEVDHSHDGWSDQGKLYEGYLSLKMSESVSLSVGKKTMKWGKGYAWNPVAFIDRPKNPDEPDLNLEGFCLASADFIKSFEGPLKTISLTPVAVPAYGELNDEFGEKDKLNLAARLYLLFYDTDIDFMFITKGSRTSGYGFDLSKNLMPNLEIHGELAWQPDSRKTVLDNLGRAASVRDDSLSLLAGLRYLTAQDTTYILEYYRNGNGYERMELEAFYRLVKEGYSDYVSGRGDDRLRAAKALAEKGYGRPSLMEDYLYLRVSQKEPFGILYLNPALSAILNLRDASFTLSPEISYTGINDMEIRIKGSFLAGEDLAEYGEKQNDFRLELRLRYYF